MKQSTKAAILGQACYIGIIIVCWNLPLPHFLGLIVLSSGFHFFGFVQGHAKARDK